MNQNKVYVNPNFKGRQIQLQTSSMHFNPKFMSSSTKEVSFNQLTSNRRVFINPNFIKVNSISHANVEPVEERPVSNVILKNTEPYFNKISKSRYSFVRQCETKRENNYKIKLPPVSNFCQSKMTSTNKKMFSVIDVQTEVKANQNLRNDSINKPSVVKTRYKIVKNTVKTQLSHHMSTLRSGAKKLCSKNVIRLNTKMKIAANKKRFKKNNIPCPLYKKYGKCLRLAIGKCEYLHDKKHVSICRRFLAGSCYDEDCVFSHNISSNKMPTCSFYLKGICTKVACPYLHVKLNEKSEICEDFLKGYCEKGSTCLKRHINKCPKASQGVCIRKCFLCQHNIKNKNLKRTSLKPKRNNSPKTKTRTLNVKPLSETPKEEIRYYKDTSDDINVTTEEIKPMRCKLGTLPSYISL